MSSAAPSTQPTGRGAWFVGDLWGATPPGPEDITMQSRPLSRSPRSTMAAASDEDSTEKQERKVATKVPAMHFSAADKQLLESSKYADAKIVANGKTYNVHKMVLCTRSVWFRKVFEGAFRVSDFTFGRCCLPCVCVMFPPVYHEPSPFFSLHSPLVGRV